MLAVVEMVNSASEHDLRAIEQALINRRRGEAEREFDKALRSEVASESANVARGGTAEEARPLSGSQGVTLANIEFAFQYQPWSSEQVDRGNQVRDALVNAGRVFLRVLPPCAGRTRVLNVLQDLRMQANHVITHGGRF